ncbi:long-chain fatty acid--CoA ligase [Patulibacter sp. NPDC049589]|uniref:AMP-dependent synthetase/ligase n=1 Tax=Patulibacter sp. NPDC049589 TaxID=3154731 RepID=UPI00343DCD03
MASTDISTRRPLPEALRAATLCEAFATTVAERPDDVALRTSGPDGVSITWSQYRERVRRIAAGLQAMGVGRGDSVALMLTNVPEFHLVDTAALHLGAGAFSLYNTSPAEQLLAPLRNSEARIAITEAAFTATLAEAATLEPTLQHVVSIDGGEGATSSLQALEEAGDPDFDLDAAAASVQADDVAVLVYTSGTTGVPKGVQHSHAGLLFNLRTMETFAPPTLGGRVVSYLPMAHIAERYISHYGSLAFGYEVTCCPDPKVLAATLAEARPTRLFAVPRILEKLALGIERAAAASPELADAVRKGRETVEAIQAGCPPQFHPGVGPEAEVVLAGLRTQLGLDQLEWFGVAAAPSPPEVLQLFHAVGLEVVEFWGMSETVFTISNPLERNKLGTVGLPLPGVEVRLADDGEILVRGENVMVGYRGDPERTAEALDADGWMHSGDVATRDADGYLTIVDRKKELIVNAAGKNMSPAGIEMAIKPESALIGQIAAIGDRRPYNVALIALDREALQGFAEQEGLVADDLAELTTHEAVVAAVDAAVARGNRKLSRVEQIKRFQIVPEKWAPGGDELTPTMKLKRRVIHDRYAPEIDALYEAPR